MDARQNLIAKSVALMIGESHVKYASWALLDAKNDYGEISPEADYYYLCLDGDYDRMIIAIDCIVEKFRSNHDSVCQQHGPELPPMCAECGGTGVVYEQWARGRFKRDCHCGRVNDAVMII